MPKMDDPLRKTHKLAYDFTIPRIINGMWQIAGGHGYIDSELAIAAMEKYHFAGFSTWDLADIYGPAEDFIGQFRHRIEALKGKEELHRVQSLTKWVPQPGTITYSIVKESIERSLRRMNVSTLDLLQFHWWDYNNAHYIDALNYLADLQREGKIKHIGLTNFDTEHMQLLVDSDMPIVSNQVQYSIIDRRPDVKMAQFCIEHGINLLAYGTICGGLMSERYLGKMEPSPAELYTLSLRKYKRMIDAWGGWDLYQELLSTLKRIARKHNVDIPNVATRFILDMPAVASVIIGVRLGITDHINSNSQTYTFTLDESDLNSIENVCTRSNNLFDTIGDCGDEYR